MFIDEIQALQERGEQLRKLRDDATEKEWGDLRRQLELLDAKCPRYDVYNVFSTLSPNLIDSDSPLAAKRNDQMVERRNDLIKAAGKAPMGPPWYACALEHRYNERQRVAYLVRAVDEHGESITDLSRWHQRFVVTAIFDSLHGAGQVEYNPNAFEILLNDDDEFASFLYDSRLSGANLDAAKQGAEVVRTCIQLLNWDREDVPTQTLQIGKPKKNGNGNKSGNGNKNGNGAKKSNPTIIKFEPFLRSMRASTHRGSGGEHASPGEHLVKGHYANFTYAHPMFGHKPVVGKTYGRIWIKQHKRGNPERGKLTAPRGIIKVGNVSDPNASQPAIPFPPPKKEDEGGDE